MNLMPTACGPRKHSKTFTGCWTCRARKVKCDEARPTCLQCRSKALHCEGYGVRLQWMPLSSEQSGAGDCDGPRVKTQRSQIATGHRCLSLAPGVIDEILGSIDGYESGQHVHGMNDDFFIHNFGVFDPCISRLPFMERSEDDPFSVDVEGRTPSNSTTPDSDPSFASIHDGHSEGHIHTDPTTQSTSMLLDSGPLYLSDDEAQLQDDFSSTFVFGTPTTTWFENTDLTLHGTREHSDESLQEDAGGIQPQHCQWEAASGAIIANPSTSLPEQEQFLMYHYSHRAVNLFCVIDNRKSPWKTIHLPRALQSIGQLSISGSSSSIRNALRNALLSISAFYLSNDSKSRLCTDEAVRWTRKATMLRGRAIELLKDAVNNDFTSKSVPKYKEFLATMLSMITINVMSGDTSTCKMHLDGAYRFMTQARTWKKNFSPKALALHRIYFYLRAIYESTALEYQDTELAPPPSTYDVPRPLRLTWPDNANLADICPSPPFSSDVSESGIQMSTYECIYGVPQNLLILFFKTTRLIGEVMFIREREGRTTLPHDLSSRSDELEQTIMDWSVDLELSRCRIDSSMGASYDIIRQTTYAFHNALVIYFAQHIRRLSYRYLQSYVQDVLESIEAIEKIKAESRILAAPIYWPAFIAASEAFNEGLQSRFRSWYDQVEVYGIEANRSGISVLSEVWKRGPTTASDSTSRWRMVVKETGAHLMLS